MALVVASRAFASMDMFIIGRQSDLYYTMRGIPLVNKLSHLFYLILTIRSFLDLQPTITCILQILVFELIIPNPIPIPLLLALIYLNSVIKILVPFLLRVIEYFHSFADCVLSCLLGRLYDDVDVFH